MTIYVPSRGVKDWQALLRDPVKHWAIGYSARTLAHCWEESGALPPEIRRVLGRHLGADDIEPLLVVPERRVSLDNDRAPSQNDVWVLARAGEDLVSMTVEGKVNEPFDVTLGEWKSTPSDGRTARLAFLAAKLGLRTPIPDWVRYQLLHRTASAVIEAERFRAKQAVMIVHSFSQSNAWFEDFVAFASLFGQQPNVDQLVTAPLLGNMTLHLAWVRGDERFLKPCTCCSPDAPAENERG